MLFLAWTLEFREFFFWSLSPAVATAGFTERINAFPTWNRPLSQYTSVSSTSYTISCVTERLLYLFQTLCPINKYCAGSVCYGFFLDTLSSRFYSVFNVQFAPIWPQLTGSFLFCLLFFDWLAWTAYELRSYSLHVSQRKK